MVNTLTSSGSGAATSAATAAGTAAIGGAYVDKSSPSSSSSSIETHSAAATPIFAALWPCAFYLCCSFAMNMLTKTLLTTYQWRALYALGAIQNTFTMASVLAVRSGQLVWAVVTNSALSAPATTSVLGGRPLGGHARLQLSYVMRVMLPLVALHIGNMILGFASMRMVNMPM